MCLENDQPNSTQDELCYICGEALFPPINRDHLPPKQFFAKAIRQKHHPNLFTLPVHESCNSAYQHDEDYFVNSLLPFARGSYAGDKRLAETVAKFHRGQQVPLVTMVLNEFETRPSGLSLPHGKVVKRLQGDRIRRVILKMVRGLYLIEYGDVLPQQLTSGIEIIPPGQKPPDHFFLALQTVEEKGNYPGVFCYKARKFPEVHNMHYWALLLWDRLIIIVMFHDPGCKCDECITCTSTALNP